MSPQRMHEARDAYLISRVGQVVTMRLKKRECFVLVTRDAHPIVAPDDGPGTYEIDIIALSPKGTLPAIVMVVPRAHARAFESMPIPMVNNMLDQAVLNSAAGHA